MKVFRGNFNAASQVPCALAIGNFDGVHRGHQALLARLREVASKLGLESAVMTFEPHPREFFATRSGDLSRAPKRITGLRDKLASLAIANVDRVIVEHFNPQFASFSPQEFVEKVLVQGLQVKWLIVGEDFCYGANRAGNVETLIAAGRQHGFHVESQPTVTSSGTRISSSAVRTALMHGDFKRAEALLGHPYWMSGHVIHGKKLGRVIGFPTLNMRPGQNNPILSGSYVVQVHGLAQQPLPGVASVGVRPTVDDSGRVLLETHIFDYSAQCYGALIRVEFLKKLRNEEKYEDVPTLIAAIANDVAQARAYFQLPSAAAPAAGRI